MLAREMPHDAYHGGGGEEPTNDEIQALRDWIAELKVEPADSCPGRSRLTGAAVASRIAGALGTLPPEAARQRRFISLANLYNTCVPDADLAGYRQAVVKVFNSLTWSPEPVRVETVGRRAGGVDDRPAGARLDPRALGADRRRLSLSRFSGRDAAAGRSSRRQVRAIRSSTAIGWRTRSCGRRSITRCWDLPSRFGNLQRILRVDVDAGARRGSARRAGLRQSGEVRGSRIVERHGLTNGALWLSYDFVGSSGRQSVFEHPMGPVATDAARVPFRHDASRVMFTLPNGFTAFAVHDVRGERLDRAPPELDRDRPGARRGAEAGSYCLACHDTGPMPVKDEVRAHVEADRTTSAAQREAVMALFASQEEFAKHVEADRLRLTSALLGAGLDPSLRIRGHEPINALASAHRRPVSAVRLAADLGLELPALRQRLAAVTGATAVSSRALRQGTIRRAAANLLVADLLGGRAAAPAGCAAGGVGRVAARPGGVERSGELCGR